MTLRLAATLCLAQTACETRAEELARLRTESEAACAHAQATRERMDSTAGHWMATYPDTLLHVLAAFGDSLEARQAECDRATETYERALGRE